MKVMKGGSKEAREVKNPMPAGGSGLRAGIAHLKKHHAENKREAPARPEHRRGKES